MISDRDLAIWIDQVDRVEERAAEIFRDADADANERASAEAAFRLARPLKGAIEKWVSSRARRAARSA